jgi:hypothetical protein
MPAVESSADKANGNQFAVKDCALIAIATGKKASTLPELRDGLQMVDPGCIYYHFWGGLLQARFEEREYNNDFASWARHGLHDAPLAERLAVIDPTDFHELEALRREVVDIVEERLDESETLAWNRAVPAFEFIHSQIVVFDTHRRLDHPRELAELVRHLSTSSIFYHFIDARRRMDGGRNDFSAWLASLDGRYTSLLERLGAIDPYFGNLAELREQIAAAFSDCFPENA